MKKRRAVPWDNRGVLPSGLKSSASKLEATNNNALL